MIGRRLQLCALTVLIILVTKISPAALFASTLKSDAKLRVCVLTDISGDPDDQQSLVRFLTYANEFDIEGLIATTSCWKQTNPDVGAIRRVLDAYEKVRPNLLLHDPEFPTAMSLRHITKSGVNGYGMKAAAEQLENEGIDHILSILDCNDPRPVWFLSWGGSNTLGGAVMKVTNTRSTAQAEAFVSWIRGYEIALQDDGFAYIAHHYPNAKLISSRLQWKGISKTTSQFNAWAESWGGDNSLFTHDWIRQNVQEAHGLMGGCYPRAIYLWEGDTPAFLYLIPNGLGDPEHPSYGSWGGRFGVTPEPYVRSGTGNNTVDPLLDLHRDYALYTDACDTWTKGKTLYTENAYAPIFRWRTAFQHDFQARMDWCVRPYDQANHPPVARISGKRIRTGGPGEKVTLNATGSSDPDGDALTYNWWIYPEAGTYAGHMAIENADQAQAHFVIPNDAKGHTVHVILNVTDNGTPTLTRYQRVILHVSH